MEYLITKTAVMNHIVIFLLIVVLWSITEGEESWRFLVAGQQLGEGSFRNSYLVTEAQPRGCLHFLKILGWIFL